MDFLVAFGLIMCGCLFVLLAKPVAQRAAKSYSKALASLGEGVYFMSTVIAGVGIIGLGVYILVDLLGRSSH
jgi:hypothetical protein